MCIRDRPSAIISATPVASNGQPQGAHQGCTSDICHAQKGAAPANANAQHNTITRTTFMRHKGVPPQGMLKDRLAMPRYQSNWELACTIAMAKAGWVQHPIHQQAKNACPQSISQSTRAKPQGLAPSSNQPFSATKMGWLVLPIVLWRH